SASALPLFRFRTADFRLLTPDFLIFRFALRADGFNAHGGEVLAVAVRLLVLLAALLLKDDDLRAAPVLDDRRRHRAAAEFDARAVAGQQRFELDRIADLSREAGH